MARYLYRCADGAPHGYIDEEGGTDPMLYTLDGADKFFVHLEQPLARPLADRLVTGLRRGREARYPYAIWLSTGSGITQL
jgi:hypothetical protein